jgi:hypothetical protein
MGHLSPWVLCDGNLEGEVSFTGDPEGYVGGGSGDRHLSIGAHLGNLEGGSFTKDFKRWIRWVSLHRGPIWGPGEGGHPPGTLRIP